MAWLDDSPVLRDKPNQDRFVEQGLKYISRKLSALVRLPIFKILSQYFQAFYARRKIHALEQTIQQQAFDTLSSTSYVLRELLQIKKNYSHILSKQVASSTKLAMLRATVLDKAHLAFSRSERVSTHQQVVRLLTEKPSVPVPTAPVRLHWRHADYHFPTVKPPKPGIRPGYLFVHASLTMLVELLTNPSDDLVQNSINLRVSRQPLREAMRSNGQLVSSLVLKYTPSFMMKPKSPSFGFFQPHNEINNSHFKFDKSLLQKVEQIIFLSDKQREDFKILLTNTQNAAIIDWFNQLDIQNKLQSHPSSLSILTQP